MSMVLWKGKTQSEWIILWLLNCSLIVASANPVVTASHLHPCARVVIVKHFDLKKNPSKVNPEDGIASGSSRTGELKTQCGIGGAHWGSAVDPYAVRASKEGINEDNKFEVAIAVAVQKRLDINKRNKAAEKWDHSRGLASVEGESIPKCIAYNSCKQANNNSAKWLKVYPADSVPSAGTTDLGFDVSSNGEAVFRTSVIPEHEYVWQGGFEVDRGEGFLTFVMDYKHI
ncbi:hypothetical protein Ancab_009547 [Ancistrocladus abbreviatus]